jgi:hypothetical protein
MFGDLGFNAKNTVPSFSQGLRYTSKLMIYGFLNFFAFWKEVLEKVERVNSWK